VVRAVIRQSLIGGVRTIEMSGARQHLNEATNLGTAQLRGDELKASGGKDFNHRNGSLKIAHCHRWGLGFL
jgi:hypothetical protein